MSRGGHGGARGGVLKGATWEHDASIKLESKPSDLFPPYSIPIPAPLTEKEKREIAHYRNLRDQIHQGPLYTKARKLDSCIPAKTYGEDQYNNQYGTKSAADIDPFVGVPTYSMKYDQKKRVIPQLSGRPFNKELFPKELWSTLEGTEGNEVHNHINRIIQKKSLILSNTTPNPSSNKSTSHKTLTILEKIKNATEDEEAEGEAELEEEPEEDYDYEDDEDEMGGDYDGEQYFDGGDNDEDDGGEGGGDDY